MRSELFWALLLSTSFAALVLGENLTDSAGSRNGKVFSLFSVVTFKNTGCRSQSTMTSGQSKVRNGTCFTTSECTSKGGTASGNCAAGFGVCCLFLVVTSGSIINQNCTYIRNPGFPSAYTSTSSLSYTINKCSHDVCYLRLDFETFTTIAPTVSTEPAGYTCPDTFKITTTTSQAVPTICGKNTGQHIYLNIGNQATDSASLAFTFSTTASTLRTWEIKVSQIPCSSDSRPPDGCLQYWTPIVGRITTFNFLTTSASASSHLPLQTYSACIRRANGYCCVEYSVCEGEPSAFSLDGLTANAIQALLETNCKLDYISIPGSSPISCSTTNQSLFSKYCGSYLGFSSTANFNSPVCDCTPPFEVYVHTDDQPDPVGVYSRGVCLDYRQIPCTSS